MLDTSRSRCDGCTFHLTSNRGVYMRVQRLLGGALGGLVFIACSSAPEGEPAPTEAKHGAEPALAPPAEPLEQAVQAPAGPWALGKRPGRVRYRGGVQGEASPI